MIDDPTIPHAWRQVRAAGNDDYSPDADATQVRALAAKVQDATLSVADRTNAKAAMEDAIARIASHAQGTGDGGILGALAPVIEQARQALADATATATQGAQGVLGAAVQAAHGVLDPFSAAGAKIGDAGKTIGDTAKTAVIAIGVAAVAAPVLGLALLWAIGRKAGAVAYDHAPAVAQMGPVLLPFAPELAPAVALAGLASAHQSARAAQAAGQSSPYGLEATRQALALMAPRSSAPSSAPPTSGSSTTRTPHEILAEEIGPATLRSGR